MNRRVSLDLTTDNSQNDHLVWSTAILLFPCFIIICIDFYTILFRFILSCPLVLRCVLPFLNKRLCVCVSELMILMALITLQTLLPSSTKPQFAYAHSDYIWWEVPKPSYSNYSRQPTTALIGLLVHKVIINYRLITK